MSKPEYVKGEEDLRFGLTGAEQQCSVLTFIQKHFAR